MIIATFFAWLYNRLSASHVCSLSPTCSSYMRAHGLLAAAHRAAAAGCGCSNPSWKDVTPGKLEKYGIIISLSQEPEPGKESHMEDPTTHERSWDKLVEADRDRNAGMAIELLSAEGYANRENLTLERYIIKVLRAERDRRQAVDQIASDNALLDEVIDAATNDGSTIVEYLTSGAFLPHIGPRTTWEMSPDFLASLLTRVQERQRS
jgi:hypothetical protein